MPSYEPSPVLRCSTTECVDWYSQWRACVVDGLVAPVNPLGQAGSSFSVVRDMFQSLPIFLSSVLKKRKKKMRKHKLRKRRRRDRYKNK